MPAALVTGNIGRVELSAAATTAGAAGAAPGTTLPGLGQGGVDAVVGALVHWRVRPVVTWSAVSLCVSRRALSVSSILRRYERRSGSIVTYRIVLAVNGSGIAQTLELNDPLPANTAYVVNSITVNGQARTDAVDADQAEFSTGTESPLWRYRCSRQSHHRISRCHQLSINQQKGDQSCALCSSLIAIVVSVGRHIGHRTAKPDLGKERRRD